MWSNHQVIFIDHKKLVNLYGYSLRGKTIVLLKGNASSDDSWRQVHREREGESVCACVSAHVIKLPSSICSNKFMDIVSENRGHGIQALIQWVDGTHRGLRACPSDNGRLQQPGWGWGLVMGGIGVVVEQIVGKYCWEPLRVIISRSSCFVRVYNPLSCVTCGGG